MNFCISIKQGSRQYFIWKSLLIMKLTIALLITAMLQVNAAGYAQQITLNKKNASLTEIFKEIRKQNGYDFFYNSSLIKKARPVSIHVTNANLEEVLEQCFKDQPLVYTIDLNTVIVQEKQEGAAPGNPLPLPPAPLDLKGKVTDEQGEPLPGATVRIKSTGEVVLSDLNGEFSIPDLDEQAVLVISYTGFQQQEVAVDGRTRITIALQVDLAQLSEVVVVGYGTQKKVTLTGSVSTIDAESLESRPITTSSQALQGVRGVYVNQAGGQPGADEATIRIRGVGTLNNSDPLVLVNGIEYDFRDVNPNDIESISVLKDAASAAIYGNRAANGVVLITTKKGKKGDMQVDYNNYFGWQQATYLPDMVTNSVDWMISRNQASINEGQPLVFTQEQIEEFRTGNDADLYPNTNWFDLMFRKSPMQEHNIRLSGGSERVTYSLSLGYLDQEGILIKTGAQKYSLNSTINFDVSDKLNAGIHLSSTYWNKDEWGRPIKGGGDAGVMGLVYRALPIHPDILADGRFGDTWLTVPGHNIFRNPMASAESTGNTRTLRGLANLFAEYTFPFNITYKINLAANKFDGLQSQFIPEIFIYNPKAPDNPRPMTKDPRSVTRWDDNNLNTTFFQTLNWTGDIAEQHHLNVLLGFSRETFEDSYFDAYIEGFLGNRLTELDAGTLNKDLGGTSSKSSLMSYFGRINYDFADKYLFEVDFRYDGSSRFAKDERWGFFPSFSAGWRIDQEAFMQNALPFVSNLKLRASWGQLGNQNVPLYSYVNSVNIVDQGYSFGNTVVPGAAVTTLADPDISWERTTITNIGLDVGLWNDKMTFNVDIFNKETTDILANINVPAQVGNLMGPVTNLYSMSNKGVELGVSYLGAAGNLNYNLGGNISYLDNEVTFLNGDVQYSNNMYGNLNIIKEGYPVNSYYLYEATGIFNTQEEVDNHAYQGPGTAPGDIRYRDINQDNKIDSQDRIITGRSVPTYTYGFNLGLDYKGFDLAAFFQGIQGVDIYPTGNIAFPNFNGAGITKDQLANSWTPENTDAAYPRLTLPKRGSRANYQNSTFWLRDASYLRLKNLQIGYSVSSDFLDKIRASRLRIFANAQNLLTFSDYTLTDPERNILQTDIYEYPSVKIFSLGVNVIFK